MNWNYRQLNLETATLAELAAEEKRLESSIGRNPSWLTASLTEELQAVRLEMVMRVYQGDELLKTNIAIEALEEKRVTEAVRIVNEFEETRERLALFDSTVDLAATDVVYNPFALTSELEAAGEETPMFYFVLAGFALWFFLR